MHAAGGPARASDRGRGRICTPRKGMTVLCKARRPTVNEEANRALCHRRRFGTDSDELEYLTYAHAVDGECSV